MQMRWSETEIAFRDEVRAFLDAELTPAMRRDVNVNIADRPEVNAPKVQVLRELELVTVTPAIAQERGLRRAYGALVYRTSPLIADQTGLQQGDVILQINNTPIRVAQDVAKAIDLYASRGYLRVIFERQGQVSWTEFGIR